MRIKQFLQVAALVALAGGIGPAYSAVWQWSKTAASNGTADPTLNWAEGMSPSSVNDSARAQMARTAEWRDDISGSLVAGGTTTAMTLTTNASTGGNGLCPAAAAPIDGTMLAFRTNGGNGASPTIAIDSCTAKPLQMTYGTAMASGTMTAGSIYRITYSSSAVAWILEGLQNNPSIVPLGALIPYTGTTVPNSNFILPAGQCISTTTYATYWALMGSPGVGVCPGGQFQVIDLRGKVLAGLDNLNGSAAGLMTSSGTGCGTAMTSVGAVCANGNQSHTLTLAEMPAHAHTGTTGGHSVDHTHEINVSSSGVAGSGGFFRGAVTSSTMTSGGVSANHSHDFTTTTVGSSTTHSIVQPTMAVTYLLRVI